MIMPNKTDDFRDSRGKFLPGNPGSPGRPKGKTMKEFAREFLMNKSDEEKKKWLRDLNPEIVWKMAEGNPAQDFTSGGEKIVQIPIYGGQSLQEHDSDQEDISIE